MIGVALVYAGLAALAAGIVSLLKPLRFLGIRSRRRAGAIAVAGAALVVLGASLPAPLRRSERKARIDEFMPEYQFAEFHEIRVHAPPAQVYRAILGVTAREIRLFRILTWIRSPRRPWKDTEETILSPPADRPILDVATSSGFGWLAREPDRELVVGTLVVAPRPVDLASPADFAALDDPGYAKAVMNFRIEDQGNGWCRLTTETRVFATDASTRRGFAAYWRVIYPGSALIRRMWLRAVRERAEGASPG
jgi:hypothetical protein